MHSPSSIHCRIKSIGIILEKVNTVSIVFRRRLYASGILTVCAAFSARRRVLLQLSFMNITTRFSPFARMCTFDRTRAFYTYLVLARRGHHQMCVFFRRISPKEGRKGRTRRRLSPFASGGNLWRYLRRAQATAKNAPMISHCVVSHHARCIDINSLVIYRDKLRYRVSSTNAGMSRTP